MTDREQEAIEFLKALKDLQIVLTCSFWNKGEFKFNTLQKEQFDIILNLISRLQQEVEEQDETIEKSVEEQKEREKYTHELEEKLAKKDKVIKLMAFEMAENTGSCPLDIFDWENKKYNNCDSCNNTYKECFIEYFYEKAEEENE